MFCRLAGRGRSPRTAERDAPKSEARREGAKRGEAGRKALRETAEGRPQPTDGPEVRPYQTRGFEIASSTRNFREKNLKGEMQYEKDDDSCDDGGVRAGRGLRIRPTQAAEFLI